MSGSMHLTGPMSFSIGQSSQKGRKPANEDSIGIRIPEGALLATKGVVAAIADGVSAAEAGKEASESSVHNFLYDYYCTPESWSVKQSAQKVLTALNRWLYGQGQRYNDAQKGFVTTFSIVVFKSRTAHIFHVGDTRIYRIRGSEIEQLTRDHATRISESQTYLTRAMGLDIKVDIDYKTVDLEIGDIFLLTTDGIHDYVDPSVLYYLIKNNENYEDVCKQLISQAYNNNSPDNLSCQILRIEQLPNENVEDVYSQLTELPFPPDLKVGMTLDGYLITDIIHQSNRSQLYRVQDKESGAKLVMKTPSVNYEDDPAYIERFIMESWIGKRIKNSHVVRVVEPKRQQQFLYYLAEDAGSMSLRDWMKENPKASIEKVMRIVEQIGLGLRAFHRRETLHQDIKPENIMIDSNGQVKIIDFGSCYVAGVAEIAAPFVRDIALGTETYSAPEYTLGRDPTPRSDMFSLAVIIYEMVAGVLPFDGKLESCKTVKDYTATKYVPTYMINPLTPIWFDGALKRALRLDESLRYGDISEFIYELQHPNVKYTKRMVQPWVEKDPVMFWKATAGVLALSQWITLMVLANMYL